MKGRGTKDLEQFKKMSLEIQEAPSKIVAITGKKKKKKGNVSNQSYIPTRGIYLQKIPRH